MECGLSDIFSRYICSTVAETIGVTNYTASFFCAKNVQKTKFEAAEMILGPWNQQCKSLATSPISRRISLFYLTEPHKHAFSDKICGICLDNME